MKDFIVVEMDAQLTWSSWGTQWSACVKCPIGTWAHRHVLGNGSQHVKILMIGEGPGRSEDALGIPFIGKSGRLLSDMFKKAGIDSTALYITNLVACRPCNSPQDQNRAPTETEVYNCQPRLIQLLHLLKPLTVVLIGRTSQLYMAPLLRQLKWNGRVVHLVHPAFILRSGGVASPEYERALRTLTSLI